ncbi:MAG: ASCH domain-containing protein [Chitinophagales bacterium]
MIKIEKMKENQNSLFKKPEQLWSDFVAKNPSYKNAQMPLVEHFCDNEKDANQLEQLTYDGTKTATCSLYAAYEMDNENLPKVGNLTIVTTWKGEARSILRVVKVSIRKFKDIDAVWARKEGEGDFSLDYWQKGHWAFFERETKNYGLAPSENMLLVCEEFERIN